MCMRFDEYGRRFISVPSVKVPAEVICTDETDTEFWAQLEKFVGAPVRENLGLRSNYLHQTFLEKDAPSSLTETETEIFAHEYFMKSLGSSRHLLLGRYLWKGVGRNQLAVQGDWLHSWGGMKFSEGVTEFILSSLLGSRYAVPVKALLRYKDRTDGGGFFLLRDQRWPRLATVPYNHNREAYSRSLKDTLANIFGSVDPWEGFLSNLAGPYLKGFVHRSPTSANFDISGRLLDLSGSFFFPGKNIECVWMDEGKIENPLDPIFWLVENCFVPLYARALGIHPDLLLEKAKFFFSGRFLLFRKTPDEIRSLINKLPPESKVQFGNWIIFPAKKEAQSLLPESFVSRKVELLSETLSPGSDPSELGTAIDFALENIRKDKGIDS